MIVKLCQFKIKIRQEFFRFIHSILSERNDNKTYSSRISVPISRLQWERSGDTFTIWGSGSRVCLKPLEKPSIDEWSLKLKEWFIFIRVTKTLENVT